MKALDLIIIFGYLIGIVLFGAWFARKQKTTADYFLGDRSVPWWAVAFSIVATETSTITFISIPGVAFARGGNFGFLQLVFGYLLGRIVISLLFIPSYFRGELLTVYQLLDQRFGGKIKMVAASLFVVMRNIADGIRLLLTAIVLSAVYATFQPAANSETIIIASIILIGLAMIIFHVFRRHGSCDLGRGGPTRHLHRRRHRGRSRAYLFDRWWTRNRKLGGHSVWQVFPI